MHSLSCMVYLLQPIPNLGGTISLTAQAHLHVYENIIFEPQAKDKATYMYTNMYIHVHVGAQGTLRLLHTCTHVHYIYMLPQARRCLASEGRWSLCRAQSRPVSARSRAGSGCCWRRTAMTETEREDSDVHMTWCSAVHMLWLCCKLAGKINTESNWIDTQQWRCDHCTVSTQYNKLLDTNWNKFADTMAYMYMCTSCTCTGIQFGYYKYRYEWCPLLSQNYHA